MKYFSLGLTVLCIFAVAISLICVHQIQYTNQKALDYNNQLQSELFKFQFTVDNQAYVLRAQVNAIEQLTNEKQQFTKIAIDLRTENYDLKKNTDTAFETIEYLMEQIVGYQQRLEEETVENLDGIFVPW